MTGAENRGCARLKEALWVWDVSLGLPIKKVSLTLREPDPAITETLRANLSSARSKMGVLRGYAVQRLPMRMHLVYTGP